MDFLDKAVLTASSLFSPFTALFTAGSEALVGQEKTAEILKDTASDVGQAVFGLPNSVLSYFFGDKMKKIRDFIYSILKWPLKMLRFDYDFLTGRAFSVYGIAPYLAFVGMMLIPLQIMFPRLLDYPLEFIGISDVNLVSFQVYSAVYWVLLMIYEIFSV